MCKEGSEARLDGLKMPGVLLINPATLEKFNRTCCQSHPDFALSWSVPFRLQQITTNLAAQNNTHYYLIVSVGQESRHTLSCGSYKAIIKVLARQWSHLEAQLGYW